MIVTPDVVREETRIAVQFDGRAIDAVLRTLDDDGIFPNNHLLPVVHYPHAIRLDPADPAVTIEAIYARNGWVHPWRNGIFTYHHYHATAHEVLAIASGWAQVQLGGDGGPVFDLRPGDVVILPAGVAHRNLGHSDDLVVVGAYPPDQIWDINTGGAGERPRADENIAAVPLPPSDPVLGDRGPLVDAWGLRPRWLTLQLQ